ncbi:MAG: hypothetical protein JEZ00_21545 [Anaerolineaceae bacterium]|nr:hypothetical protein [Anaerolineaceae bacterium]
MKIEITLAQIQSEFGNPQKNFNRVNQIVNKIQPTTDHLLILPELWSSGFDLKQSHLHINADQEILQELSTLSTQKNIWIAGSYLTQENSNYFNTFVLLGPGGKKSIYRKIHLIKLMHEHHWLQAGDQYVAVSTAFAQFGLTICYDLRFPTQFQALSHSGCNIFLMPAAWPIARIKHWQALTLARAIENQAFFIACNAVGGTHRETFGGCSAIISPFGEILLQGSQTKELIQTIEINPQEADDLRCKFPVLSEQVENDKKSYSVITDDFSI